MVASTQWTVESFRDIEDQKVPYLLVDRRFTGFPAHFIGVDDEQTGFIAVEHLISQGCTRIAKRLLRPIEERKTARPEESLLEPKLIVRASSDPETCSA